MVAIVARSRAEKLMLTRGGWETLCLTYHTAHIITLSWPGQTVTRNKKRS